MTSLMRRERPVFGDLLDWFDDDIRGLPVFRALTGEHMIRLEECTEDGTYVIRAELPGVDPEKDVEITLTNGMLRLTAERRETRKDVHRSEFRYGSFARSMRLPEGVEEEDVAASYRDGVLEIRVPLAEEKKPETKRIPINKA